MTEQTGPPEAPAKKKPVPPYFWTLEQARENAAKGGKAAQAKKAELKKWREEGGRKQDLPFQLRAVTEKMWTEEYLNRTFDEPFRTMYQHTLRDLKKHYAPNKREAPQYTILVQRAAVLHTLVRWMEADRKPISERNAVDQRLKEYVAQLQRYTEAEKRVDILIDAAQFKILEHVVAIAEYEIEDSGTLHRYLSALQRAVDGSALGDDRSMKQLLTATKAGDATATLDGEYTELEDSNGDV